MVDEIVMSRYQMMNKYIGLPHNYLVKQFEHLMFNLGCDF